MLTGFVAKLLPNGQKTGNKILNFQSDNQARSGTEPVVYQVVHRRIVYSL